MGQPKPPLPLALVLILTAGWGLQGSDPCARELVWELDTPTPSPLAPSSPPAGPAPQAATSAAGPAPAATTTALVWSLDTETPTDLAELNASPSASPTSGTGAGAGGTGEGTAGNPAELVGVPLLQPFPPPNLGGGLPTAYNANWGDYFISVAGATPGKLRAGQVDGSVNLGVGFGDSQRLLSIELDWNIGSTRNFNANGSFDISASRMLLNERRLQVVVAGGVQGLYTYGNEAKPPINGYGVVSVATPLRTPNAFFNQVLQISAGVGGNNFAPLDANFEGPTTGYFAALGLEITSNVGLSMGWSGRGVNLNLSFTPVRDLPFTVNLLGVDLFNNSPFGTVGVLSVSWGDNFRTALF